MRRFARLALAAIAVFSLAACGNEKLAKENLQEGTEFLETNAKAEGVKVLPSGVQYRVIRSGPSTGVQPRKGDELKVHYEGKLLNGTVFDSSYERGAPAVMPFRSLIKAWMEILPMMRPGDEWFIYVPPEMGYGEDGGGPIPPNAVLIFRIELIDVLPAGGNQAQG